MGDQVVVEAQGLRAHTQQRIVAKEPDQASDDQSPRPHYPEIAVLVAIAPIQLTLKVL